ncbi:hypothetical protein CRG98_048459 [Punica granatum]|uniref:Eukaryotic translation initiation factor 4B2 n=1 Tax=Punica granatum TaxID=22663 RepID=A0A2I0HHF7_PUNGR|nr:hypothetical protein CRG98_048459 [Punica granatum]
MSKAWGVGSWAAEADAAEEEERQAAAAAAMAGPEPQSFPSLKEAATAKSKKKKMSLTEFHSAGSTGTGSSSAYKGLTTDEMLRLPTGPKEHSAEELQHGRLGGGFSSYGRSGPMRGRMHDEGDSSWGGGGSRRSYGGGFDDDRRGPLPSRASDFDQPSRADEVDNWATTKKTLPSFDSSRPGRYNSLGGGGGGGGSSRADEADNWTFGKKPQFQPPPPARHSSFSSGFHDSRTEPDRWTRGEPLPSERPRLVLAPPKENSNTGADEPAKPVRPSPFGAARPREEVLAEKGLDFKKLDLEIEAKKTGGPTSASSSRPSSAQSARSESTENVVKPRPKVNPFGDAKPREVLLEEKGMDWRKIDFELEHRRVDRPETEQEKILKEQIESLKLELEREVAFKGKTESLQGSEEDQTSVRFILSQKEKELELLIRDLDDKVRFGQKAVDRPSSRAGSVSSFSERPPSRSSSVDESRSVDHSVRPLSRGTGDAWGRPISERRTFQGSREKGFFTNRDFDGSSSRQRW